LFARRPAVVAAGFAERSSLQGINRHSWMPLKQYEAWYSDTHPVKTGEDQDTPQKKERMTTNQKARSSILFGRVIITPDSIP
jgi:hypothetical protein